MRRLTSSGLCAQEHDPDPVLLREETDRLFSLVGRGRSLEPYAQDPILRQVTVKEVEGTDELRENDGLRDRFRLVLLRNVLPALDVFDLLSVFSFVLPQHLEDVDHLYRGVEGE